MSRYTGPSWKQARRLGLSYWYSSEIGSSRNPYLVNMWAVNNRSKLSVNTVCIENKTSAHFTV